MQRRLGNLIGRARNAVSNFVNRVRGRRTATSQNRARSSGS